MEPPETVVPLRDHQSRPLTPAGVPTAAEEPTVSIYAFMLEGWEETSTWGEDQDYLYA